MPLGEFSTKRRWRSSFSRNAASVARSRAMCAALYIGDRSRNLNFLQLARYAAAPVRYNSGVQLTFTDWLVVALYFLFNLAIGFYYKSPAGKSVREFFLSGR